MDVEYLEPDLNDEETIPIPEETKIIPVKKQKKSVFESGRLSSFTPAELSSLFTKYTSKAFSSLSQLEIEDLALKGIRFEFDFNTDYLATAFGPGSGVEGDQNLFEKFFTRVVENWELVDNRRPVILIISTSAIRCVELLKYLPLVRSKLQITKLFAKHFKMDEQKAFLANHTSPVAIGTPARILKLAEDEDKAIDLIDVTHVIIDSYRDAKSRTIFDIPEVRIELLKLMTKTALRTRLNTLAAKIVIF